MKLLTKTSLNFISASVFFFFIGSLGGYYFIRYAVNKYLNLELEEAYIQLNQKKESASTNLFTYIDLEIDTLSSPQSINGYILSDTIKLNKQTGKAEYFRKLTFVKANQKVALLRPTAPSDLLIMRFTLMLTFFPILFFLILYFVNRQATKYALTVFYDTIKKLRSFDVNKENKLDLMTSDVDEFEQLNVVFSAMDAKIKEDYERLKQYTENTSHELQTPLAIITSRLDELLQSPNLGEEEMKIVVSLMDTTSRLSKTNQALIFLAKLDNRLFAHEEPVDMLLIINEQLVLLEPFIETKELSVEVDSNATPLILTMNKTLAHTLVQNLLKNAIRHNINLGYIRINCNQEVLTISNSGIKLVLTPDEIFHRFKKDSLSNNSLGIGLSIVKRICEISNLSITYSQHQLEHTFRLAPAKA